MMPSVSTSGLKCPATVAESEKRSRLDPNDTACGNHWAASRSSEKIVAIGNPQRDYPLRSKVISEADRIRHQEVLEESIVVQRRANLFKQRSELLILCEGPSASCSKTGKPEDVSASASTISRPSTLISYSSNRTSKRSTRTFLDHGQRPSSA